MVFVDSAGVGAVTRALAIASMMSFLIFVQLIAAERCSSLRCFQFISEVGWLRAVIPRGSAILSGR